MESSGNSFNPLIPGTFSIFQHKIKVLREYLGSTSYIFITPDRYDPMAIIYIKARITPSVLQSNLPKPIEIFALVLNIHYVPDLCNVSY